MLLHVTELLKIYLHNLQASVSSIQGLRIRIRIRVFWSDPDPGLKKVGSESAPGPISTQIRNSVFWGITTPPPPPTKIHLFHDPNV